jgi:hypothetical protein
MTFSMFDVVVLAEDIPSMSLKGGMQGTVIEVHLHPRLAYEVEFCDDNGATIATLSLYPEQLREKPAWSKPA